MQAVLKKYSFSTISRLTTERKASGHHEMTDINKMFDFLSYFNVRGHNIIEEIQSQTLGRNLMDGDLKLTMSGIFYFLNLDSNINYSISCFINAL